MDPGFRLDDRYRMERRVPRRGAAEVRRAHAERLARRAAVTLERVLPAAHEALSLCALLADAPAAVRACGVVHGDLRPAQAFPTVPVQS